MAGESYDFFGFCFKDLLEVIRQTSVMEVERKPTRFVESSLAGISKIFSMPDFPTWQWVRRRCAW
jgi:hypothetical protein